MTSAVLCGALGESHRLFRFDRVARLSAEHDPVASGGNGNRGIAQVGFDHLRDQGNIDVDLDFDDADQLFVGTKDRDVGRAGLFALDIQTAIRHRQGIGDVGRADHCESEWRRDLERLRFVLCQFQLLEAVRC